MQSIKICPKCNQAATDGNTAFCAYDGTALVEMQPMQTQQWQQPPAVQPQVIPTPSATPKKKMNPLLIGCLALIAIPIILVVLIPTLSAIFYSAGKARGSKTDGGDISISTPQSQTPVVSATPSVSSPSSLSSAENFEAGKKALNGGDTDKATAHLTAIPKTAKEYKQAQSLLTRMKREGEKIDPAQERNDAEKFRDSIQRLSNSLRDK